MHMYSRPVKLILSLVTVNFEFSSGQNKNNAMVHYLMWRVAKGLNTTIELNFMIAGHTKFAPDRHFGSFKSLFRKTCVISPTNSWGKCRFLLHLHLWQEINIWACVNLFFFHFIIHVWSVSALILFWFFIRGSREVSQGQHAICSWPLICFLRLGRVSHQLLQTAPRNPGATPDYCIPSRCVHEEESQWWVHICETDESE